jgi:hypothetical protein
VAFMPWLEGLGTSLLSGLFSQAFQPNPGQEMADYIRRMQAATSPGNIMRTRDQLLMGMAPQINEQYRAASNAASNLGQNYAREAGQSGISSGIGAVGKGLASANYGGAVSQINAGANQAATQQAMQSLTAPFGTAAWLPTHRPGATLPEIFGGGLGNLGTLMMLRSLYPGQPQQNQQYGQNQPQYGGPNLASMMFQQPGVNQFQMGFQPGYNQYQNPYFAQQMMDPYYRWQMQYLFGGSPFLGQSQLGLGAR